jgi:hypothetical protein
MKVYFNIFLHIIAAAVIFLLLFRTCKRDTVTTTTQTITTVRIDTLRLRDTFYFPTPYRVVELQIDSIHVDTAAIIRDYYSEKYYQIHHTDSLLNATAEIKIAENTIKLTTLDYQIFRPTIHTTTIVTQKRINRFFFSAGGGINYNIMNNRAGVELLAAVGIKRHSLHIGYDFLNQTPRLGWQYRIK